MKIALTSEYFYPETGGAEQSVLELAKALKNKGHEVVVFTRGEGERDEVLGISVFRIFSDLKKGTVRRDVPFPRIVDKKEETRLKKEITREGFEILHSNNRDTAVFTAKVGSSLGIPSIAHIRDFWPICPKRDLLRPKGICPQPKLCGNCMARYFSAWHKVGFYFKMWNDTNYRLQEIKRNVDMFIYNSGYTQFRIDLKPGNVVCNPIEMDSLHTGEKEPGKILFIGNVTKRKGIEILAESVKDLDVNLHVIGDGYMLSKIDGENIIKHGKLNYEETKAHLASSEILVVPSIWPEPFGRVAVEGMAAGVPTIVSPHGALPEVVKDAGLVLKEVTSSEIRGAVLRIRSDKTLKNRLVEKGRERSTLFHPSKIADEIISLYKKLLSNG
jgi:glycosyltransferase involved in cell wall biosynthesis